MSETAVTYQDLFEKYARRTRDRNVIAIITGTVAVISIVLAARQLRELRADRQAVTGARS